MVIAFVGPLSRHYGADPAAAARLAAGVEAWRRDLGESLAERVRAQLAWDEHSDVAERHDLGAAGFVALRLFAFYAERSDLDLPETVPAIAELDAEWRQAADQKFPRTLYGQLLACDLWLPGDFPVTVRAPMPDGQAREFGALRILLDQLRWLNERTWQADDDVITSWRGLPAAAGEPLLPAAQRGFSVLQHAAERAAAATLPLLVVSG
jgi:hypothetical protein